MYIWDFINRIKYSKDNSGAFHSFHDLPAIEYLDNSSCQIWMHKGLVHRDNGPAYTYRIFMLGDPLTVCENREYYNLGELQAKSYYYYDTFDDKYKEIFYYNKNMNNTITSNLNSAINTSLDSTISTTPNNSL